MEYRIVKRRKTGRYVIVDKGGKAISQEFLKISNRGLVDGSSIYYIAEKTWGWAIFDVSGRMVSPDWFAYIWEDGLVSGESKYYKVKGRKDGKEAIFDKNGRMVSPEWFDYIRKDGLIKGKSEYYVAVKEDMQAIFDRDGNRITKWFDWISSDGLVEGESDYYLVKEDGEYAIFYKDGNRISERFDMILPEGLIKGQSDYFIAKKGNKYAIFDKNGNQISNWFDRIEIDGLVKGESDYYVACNEDTCAVYYKDGQKVSENFPIEYLMLSNIVFNENLGIAEIKKSYKTITIEFNPVYPFKEEIIDYTKLLNI
jgi:hypothetical protein